MIRLNDLSCNKCLLSVSDTLYEKVQPYVASYNVISQVVINVLNVPLGIRSTLAGVSQCYEWVAGGNGAEDATEEEIATLTKMQHLGIASLAFSTNVFVITASNSLPKLKDSEIRLLEEYQFYIFNEVTPPDDFKEKMFQTLFNNRKLNRRLMTIKTKSIKSELLDLALGITFHGGNLSIERLSHLYAKMKEILPFLISNTTENSGATLTYADLSDIMHITGLLDVDLNDFKLPYGTPFTLKEIFELAVNFIKNAELKIEALPPGSFGIINIARCALLHHLKSPVVPEIMSQGHVVIKLSKDFYYHLEGAGSSLDKFKLKDLFFYDFYKIDLESLVTSVGQSDLKKFSTLNIREEFEFGLRKAYEGTKNTPVKVAGQLLHCQQLFRKENGSLEDKKLIPNSTLTCSSFVAKVVEAAINLTNISLNEDREFRQRLRESLIFQTDEVRVEEEYKPIIFIKSPFPPQCNLNKVHPIDLKTKFPAIKHTMAHLGKLEKLLT